MGEKFILFILLFIFSIERSAAEALPSKIQSSLEKAESILWVKFNNLTEKRKLSNGKYLYFGTFKVIDAIGIQKKRIINKNYLSVAISSEFSHPNHSPLHHLQFEKNEEMILFIKLKDYGFTVDPSSFFKLSLLKYTKGGTMGGQLLMTRTLIFKLDVFRRSLPNYFKDGFFDHSFFKNDQIFRTPASGTLERSYSQHMIPSSSLSLFWLTMLLVALGFLGKIMAR